MLKISLDFIETVSAVFKTRKKISSIPLLFWFIITIYYSLITTSIYKKTYFYLFIFYTWPRKNQNSSLKIIIVCAIRYGLFNLYKKSKNKFKHRIYKLNQNYLH